MSAHLYPGYPTHSDQEKNNPGFAKYRTVKKRTGTHHTGYDTNDSQQNINREHRERDRKSQPEQ